VTDPINIPLSSILNESFLKKKTVGKFSLNLTLSVQLGGNMAASILRIVGRANPSTFVAHTSQFGP
jgi:hypothetical protein